MRPIRWGPALGIVLGACGGLVGLEELQFVDDDGGAGPGPAADGGDAGDLEDAKPSQDASLDTRQPTCRERHAGDYDGGEILFCDDFERDGGPSDGWNGLFERNGGTVTLESAGGTAGPAALLIGIDAGTSPQTKRAYLQLPDLPGGTEVAAVELDFRLDVAPPPGGFGASAFTLGNCVNVGGGFKSAFVAVPSVGELDPLFLATDPAVPFPQGEWLHLTWSTVSTTQQITVTSKTAPTTTAVRTALQPQLPRYFWIGAEANSGIGPVRMLVDDVVVHR